jgi:hypothetical protein
MFTRPKTIQHAILGRYKLWLHSGGLCRVGRFQDLDGMVFYAQVRKEAPWGLMWDMISRHRKLSAAKRAVEDYLTRNGANDHDIRSVRKTRQGVAVSRGIQRKRFKESSFRRPEGNRPATPEGATRVQQCERLSVSNQSSQTKLVALLRDGCPPSRSLARSQ